MSSFVVTLKWCNKAVQWQGRPGGAAAMTRDTERARLCVCTSMEWRQEHWRGVIATRQIASVIFHYSSPSQCVRHTYTHTQLHTNTHALAYFNRMLLTGRDVHALREHGPRLFNPLLTLTSVVQKVKFVDMLFVLFFGLSDWLIRRSQIKSDFFLESLDLKNLNFICIHA